MNVPFLCLEFSRLNLDMNNKLLHLTVEDPNEMAIPACPHLSAGVLRRNRIVGLLDFNMTITMNRTLGFLEAWESAWR